MARWFGRVDRPRVAKCVAPTLTKKLYFPLPLLYLEWRSGKTAISWTWRHCMAPRTVNSARLERMVGVGREVMKDLFQYDWKKNDPCGDYDYGEGDMSMRFGEIFRRTVRLHGEESLVWHYVDGACISIWQRTERDIVHTTWDIVHTTKMWQHLSVVLSVYTENSSSKF